ncbi:hypothetical protein DFH11DRAFT_1684510, partial [Phellopilus nigrolimitatus]
DEAAALLDSEEGRTIAKTSLVVDDPRRDLVRARGNLAAEGERAREVCREVSTKITFRIMLENDVL